MVKQWLRRRAVDRVKPGDGHPLPRFRWWQALTGRALLHLDLTGPDGVPARFSVDVRHQGSGEDGRVRAHLYRNGLHHAVSRVPAVLPVPGGAIEVATSGFGVKRAHFVADDGAQRQLVPDPRSAEGRRARLERDRPVLSRVIGFVSVVMVVVGLGLNLLQAWEPISRIPPIADRIGVFVSPIALPLWLNVALVLAAALGSVERALRLRHHWLLDGSGS
ncbi:hypothetical protein HX744_27990 [Pseudonocardia sp. ICBG1122]|nr:hypothetical protein [Pseudonocardia pini]